MLVSLEQNDGSRALVQGMCPDNDVPRALDEKRILWAAGDIVENRPPVSRWHPDYAEKFLWRVVGARPTPRRVRGASADGEVM